MSKTNSVVAFVKQDAVTTRINELLGKRAPQFITSLVTAVNQNHKLATCDPQSVLNAALTAASMDLPINQNLGFAYLIPYKNKTGEVCQFQMGYKGFLQLAQKSGSYKTINADAVYEGQIKNVDKLSGEIEFSDEKTSDKVIGYFAYFKLLNGFEKVLYMTKDEVEKHGKKYSQSYKKNYGLWAEEFDTMAIKTVLKLLISKYGPMSTQLQRAVVTDQAIIDDNGNAHYIDNDRSKPDLDDATRDEIKQDASDLANKLLQDQAGEENQDMEAENDK